MRKALSILLLLGVFAAWSCQKEVVPRERAVGNGSIELRLDSGNAITLQTKTDLTEGVEFNNVLVLLVNNSGNIVGNRYISEVSPVSQDVVSFTGLLPGAYHAYAYANIDATAWQQTGANLISAKEQLATSGSFSSFLDRELAQLAGSSVPSDPSTSMLLTGHKEIAVGLSTASETIDLLRPVVRFKVTVQNHTPFPVTVNELRFSAFNPDKAYLLDHLNASGVPAIPAGVTYRTMPAFDPSGSDDNSVAADTSEVVYQRLVYENACPDMYKVFATLTLDRSSESLSNLQMGLGDHEFGALTSELLNGMAEGEQVDVLVVNPQISVRSGRILCGISSENNMVWESAGYTNFNGFMSRATAIWEEESNYNYSSRYSYSSANGYSGWDGLNASAGSQATSFDYTGARSRYFHTLTKSNGAFTLSGLALQQGNSNDNGKCLTAITGLQIEKGAPFKKNGAWKNPSDMTNNLVKLKLNSNDYIQADAIWGDGNTPNRITNLKLFAGNSDQGDRQFVLFGKYMSGGQLKRILNENKKEVPLTYMARNEEINVVLNVYYADQTGEITFSVDNSHWSDAGATISGHTFN